MLFRSVSFAELIQQGVSEIVVRKETTRDSGGAQEQDFVVLKLIDDRLEVVMNATERSEITLMNRTPNEDNNLTQTQTSTFDLLKSPPNSAATYRLLEKEVITDNKTTITRYRVWTWDPELRPRRPPQHNRPATSRRRHPRSQRPNNLNLPIQSSTGAA